MVAVSRGFQDGAEGADANPTFSSVAIGLITLHCSLCDVETSKISTFSTPWDEGVHCVGLTDESSEGSFECRLFFS